MFELFMWSYLLFFFIFMASTMVLHEVNPDHTAVRPMAIIVMINLMAWLVAALGYIVMQIIKAGAQL